MTDEKFAYMTDGRWSHHGGFLKEDWLKWLNGVKSEQTDEDCEVHNPVAENRAGEEEANKPEKKKPDIVLDLGQKGLLYRALGRIEGVASGCDEAVKKCLLLSVLQISVALGLTIEEREN